MNPSSRLSDTLWVAAGRDLQRLWLDLTPSSLVKISKMVTLPSEVLIVAAKHPVQQTQAIRIFHSNHNLFMGSGKAVEDKRHVSGATRYVVLRLVRVNDG